MKLKDKALTELMSIEGVTFEEHERVPFFIVTDESVLVDGELEFNVVENFYTEIHQGVIFAKMDSTHKNADGSFSGAEPTYSRETSTTRQLLWVEQFGDATSAYSMLELRKVSGMTPQEYRDMKIEEYKAKQDETYIEFYAPVKDKLLHFGVGSQKKFELLFQLSALESDPTKTLTLHDLEFVNHEDFTAEEAQIVVGSMMKSTLEKEFMEGAFIKRLLALEEGYSKEDVDAAASPPLTAEELAWIEAEVTRKLS